MQHVLFSNFAEAGNEHQEAAASGHVPRPPLAEIQNGAQVPLGDAASPSTVLDSSPTEANATDASLGEESANVQDDDNIADQTNGKDN